MGKPGEAVLDTLLSLAIPALVILHLIIAPYTKVEESFNIQATHDILVYGTPTSDVHRRLSARYDHFDFPGAVPRTFIGPVLLAGLSQPFIYLAGFRHAQLVVRAVLGLSNAGALLVFRARVEKAFGRPTARWYTLLQASQFHVLFYASRTLPNMFAFALTTLALAQLVGDPRTISAGRCRVAIGFFTYATAVFRSELAILLTTTTLYSLLMGSTTIRRVIPAFLGSFAFALFASVPVDSYFWQKPIWPELWGFYYNAILGSSSEWGVSPWHWYFTSALPKIMINPLTWAALIPYALFNKSTRLPAQSLTLPRSKIHILRCAPLTAAAALGANYIFARRAKSVIYAVASLVLAGSVVLSFIGSTGMLMLSSLNYPGGEALSQLGSVIDMTSPSPDVKTVTVHTDVLSCMTGVTLFGQLAYPKKTLNPAADTVSFVFDKSEKPALLQTPGFWGKFDYVMVEDPSKVKGSWETVGVVEGFAGVELLRPGAEAAGYSDVESENSLVLGRGALVRRVRDAVRGITGGWWIGPRMEPKIQILKRLRAAPRKEVTE
ncbi:dol-P-Man:Man(7)GlcNAc(2)-PP-Dol alpha-1-6-mannosyltransferase [Apiospora rasikravindrae]|uniref:Mannosyltransferase n=1 Tax=Apiospora rasikravindrae TaxID=990691 RepID=A0ABR1UAE6_9PEZI